MKKFTHSERNLKNIGLVSVLAGLLAACSGNSYVETRDNEPSYQEITTEQEFAAALQDAYFEHATRAYDAGDTASADYYALRSIMAAEGKIVQPSDISANAFGEDYDTASKTKKRLLSQLDNGARANTPHLAAEAQASLDCWIRETTEKNMKSTRACKKQSLDVLERVEVANIEGTRQVASAADFSEIQSASQPVNTEVKGMVVENNSPKIIMAGTKSFNDDKSIKTANLTQDGGVSFISPLMKASMPREGDFAVYFGFDSSKITMEAEDILIDILQEARNKEASTIVIMGHTDTIGSSRYNNLLSLRRAQEVRKFLTDQLPEDISYRVAALGEANPIIGVGNRISQAANRRVEVAFE